MKQIKKKIHKMISGVMVLSMVLSLVPITALGAEDVDAESSEQSVSAISNWTALTSGTLSNGSYYLKKDYTGDITISGTVNLNLNGYTITGTGTTSVITIASGATLNLYDEAGEGEITGGNAVRGGGVYAKGNFNMYGGSITGNFATYGGGVETDSNYFMYGGFIYNNEAEIFGGGVNVHYTANFELYDGVISENNAEYGGGVSTGNTFIMYGGEILNNEAEVFGGGVNVEYAAYFELYDGIISENNTEYGGGVAVGDTFIMHDGEILNNTAMSMGGGVFISYGSNKKFDMHDGVVSNNVAKSYGGGVYVSESAVFTVYDCIISENVTNAGGAAYVSGEMIMYDGTIYDNEAEEGEGIFVN
ncbi:hypothetical protein [Chakrabartyella piscis]|uniref:hypothetical protein n=1 Tax=Chakrabartyella piscis TaxID=2918914 RepID=UPI002958C54F|nr:hypothetical protein [Chakrabartyella piscis]